MLGFATEFYVILSQIMYVSVLEIFNLGMVQ